MVKKTLSTCSTFKFLQVLYFVKLQKENINDIKANDNNYCDNYVLKHNKTVSNGEIVIPNDNLCLKLYLVAEINTLVRSGKLISKSSENR